MPARAGWDDVRLGAFALPEHAALGGSDAHGEVMAETGRDAVGRALRPARSPRSSRQPGHAGPWSETLPRFVAHPVGMVGTDSTFIGAKPSPRTYGSFPRILGQFVRDERLLTLEEAVRKMTSAPAARLGHRGPRGASRTG